MNRLFTVFICSTYSDLISEREAVLSAIQNMQLQHDSMEFFGARPKLPIEACLEEVRKSDILVIIIGHKYGSLVPDKGISYTEVEYTEGYRLGKPCLVYFRDESVPVLPIFMERDLQKLPLLEKFCALLASRHTVATFRDARSLASRVTTDINRTIQDIGKLPPELVEQWT